MSLPQRQTCGLEEASKSNRATHSSVLRDQGKGGRPKRSQFNFITPPAGLLTQPEGYLPILKHNNVIQLRACSFMSLSP
jgi:hypothetical protein